MEKQEAHPSHPTRMLTLVLRSKQAVGAAVWAMQLLPAPLDSSWFEPTDCFSQVKVI